DVDSLLAMTTTCRVTAGGHEATTCSIGAQCDKGYTCMGAGTNSSCHKYCSSDSDCTTPRGKCAVDFTYNGVPLPNLPSVCSSNRDPSLTTAQPECPPNWKCSVWFGKHDGADVQYADCWPAGTGTQGVNCRPGANPADELCARGYECVTIDGGTVFR